MSLNHTLYHVEYRYMNIPNANPDLTLYTTCCKELTFSMYKIKITLTRYKDNYEKIDLYGN